MRGNTFRRCGCRDAAGRQLGKACPDLAKRSHGTAGFAVWIDTIAGRQQLRRSGYRTITDAAAALELVRDLVKVAGDDPATKQRIGDLLFERTKRRGDLPTVDELRRRLGTAEALDRTMTTGAWLNEWLDGRRKLRASTRASYRSHLDLYLVPHLGDIPLERLRAVHIVTMFDAIVADPRRGSSMSPATMHRVRATLRSALNAAVRQGRIAANPAAHVELASAERPKVSPWEADDLGRFLDSIAQDRLAAYYELTAMTGLRRGEALGLCWSDVDLPAGKLRVRRALLELDGRLYVGRPKTRSGEDRVVDLDEGTIGLLLGHRLRQDAERATWADAWCDVVDLVDEHNETVQLRALIFTREDGSPVRPGYATKHFAELAAAAGVPKVRLHDLRHGQASLMIAAGVPIEVVSKRLGHSSIAITADTYTHLLEGVGRRAADAAAALVPRNREHTLNTHGTTDDLAADDESVFPQVNPGGPRGTRTHNPRIKSPLLCH